MGKRQNNPCGSSYDRGCKCDDCLRRHREQCYAYEKKRRTVDIATGDFTRSLNVSYRIPAQVITQLRVDAGMTYDGIAKATGLDRVSLCRIVKGKHKTVQRSTADALYNLQSIVEDERPDLAEKWESEQWTS